MFWATATIAVVSFVVAAVGIGIGLEEVSGREVVFGPKVREVSMYIGVTALLVFFVDLFALAFAGIPMLFFG